MPLIAARGPSMLRGRLRTLVAAGVSPFAVRVCSPVRLQGGVYEVCSIAARRIGCGVVDQVVRLDRLSGLWTLNRVNYSGVAAEGPHALTKAPHSRDRRRPSASAGDTAAKRLLTWSSGHRGSTRRRCRHPWGSSADSRSLAGPRCTRRHRGRGVDRGSAGAAVARVVVGRRWASREWPRKPGRRRRARWSGSSRTAAGRSGGWVGRQGAQRRRRSGRTAPTQLQSFSRGLLR
jgi:hypothetical protein